WQERRRDADLPHPTPRHNTTLSDEASRDLFEQARFADAKLAAEHQERAFTAQSSPNGFIERLNFALASDQHSNRHSVLLALSKLHRSQGRSNRTSCACSARRLRSQSPVQYTESSRILSSFTSARMSSRQYQSSPSACHSSSTSSTNPIN